uniref:Uncharacterized protein n=1 Tax=Nothobranchius kadleci TaxID=1051664 RepID=A0A1A8DR51_NOTKA
MPTDLTNLSAVHNQDEGPQHLISTSAVKVQRLLALLHIMKEGWSLDPPGKPLEDWVAERRIPESLFFIGIICLFSLFCFGVCGRRFFAETDFLLLFFRHDEKRKLYRLILLKACIQTQDTDEVTKTETNQTYNYHEATLNGKPENKKTLYMYK